jgi:hypothetical protein
MKHIDRIVTPVPFPANLVSLTERLVTLALDAEGAGLHVASEHLLYLALQVRNQPDGLRA